MYIKNVDFLITTFLRPEMLEQLIRSIRECGYDNRIIVGDQTKPSYAHQFADENTQVIELPYDCGLSYARNRLVEASTAKHVLILEDDFLFTKDQTKLGKMKKIMSIEPNVGIVGGMVMLRGAEMHFEFIPTVKDGMLSHEKDGDKYKEFSGVRYKKTGCVPNFFLANRKVFDDIQWDEDLKLREHQDFFLRFKDTKWRILYTPEVSVKDMKEPYNWQYKVFKARDEFLVKMMEKHGLYKIKYQNGTCRELSDGKIVKYKEAPI